MAKLIHMSLVLIFQLFATLILASRLLFKSPTPKAVRVTRDGEEYQTVQKVSSAVVTIGVKGDIGFINGCDPTQNSAIRCIAVDRGVFSGEAMYSDDLPAGTFHLRHEFLLVTLPARIQKRQLTAQKWLKETGFKEEYDARQLTSWLNARDRDENFTVVKICRYCVSHRGAEDRGRDGSHLASSVQ